MWWPFSKSKPPPKKKKKQNAAVALKKAKRPSWNERLRRYQREVRLRPDYTQLPGVEEEVKNPGSWARKHAPPPSRKLLDRSRKFQQGIFQPGSLFQFLARCLELRRKDNERVIAENSRPYREEDEKLWKSLPHVPGPYGMPMPRKAITNKEDASDTFWDFFKQFHFGLWGYRRRPYPPEKPFDIQQMLGYKWLDKRYADFVMRSGGWYYKDRLGRSRGPMELVNLKTAWAAGIVDRNTFIWGDDMDEWAPIHMVYGLEQCIDTPDVKMAVAGADLIYKITRGIPLSTPRKGHEKKSYQQLQAEALEKKEKERAVLRINKGVWPGERAPSHTLFLWAGGSELTALREKYHKYMPDKFIPYRTRKRMAEVIPGLRPWEIMKIEQVMEKVTYGTRWYRTGLGSFTWRADFEEDWFDEFKDKWDGFFDDVQDTFAKVDKEALINKLKEIEQSTEK